MLAVISTITKKIFKLNNDLIKEDTFKKFSASMGIHNKSLIFSSRNTFYIDMVTSKTNVYVIYKTNKIPNSFHKRKETLKELCKQLFRSSFLNHAR